MNLLLWRAAALLTTLVILSALWLPPNRLPASSLGGADKITHVILFFVWALAAHRSGLKAWYVLTAGLVLAMGSEAGQWLMGTGRTADVADVAADLVGIAVGVTTAWSTERPPRREDRTPRSD